LTETIQSAAASVGHVVRELRPVGIATVMWTVVVCTALLHCTPDVLREFWPYLYRTWIGLVVAHAIAAAAVALWERNARPATTPVISAEADQPSTTSN